MSYPRTMFLLALAVLLLVPLVGRAEIRVMTLRHVSADNVLPMVQDLLGEGGQVSQWENRLIVNAAADKIAVIEEVLRQIDVAPVMLRVTVRTDNRRVQAGNRIGVALMQSGEPGSGAGHPLPEGRQLGNATDQTEYFLRVRDGGQGFILMGKSIPFVREMLALAGRHGGYSQSIDFQDINTGFWVRPVLEGDFATLDIRPHLEGMQKNAAGLIGLPVPIELHALETSVRVPLGKWVDIGGVLREADEISRAIVAWRAGNSFQEKTILIKVDRQKDL